MRDWRRFWPGRKHGTARGVAVFGGPGFADDAQGLDELLGRHDQLAGWLSATGAELQVSAAGLPAVDALIDSSRDDPVVQSQLGNQAGLFLGSVLIHEIDGAGWHLWPNGHPVVRLATGKEFDVTALIETRLRTGTPSLSAVLARAAAASKP